LHHKNGPKVGAIRRTKMAAEINSQVRRKISRRSGSSS